MDRSSLITLGVITTVILVVGLYVWYAVNQSHIANQIPSDAVVALTTTDDTYTDLDGNPVSLEQYLGAPLVVNSWASWCPFCVTELPDLNTLAEEFADQNVTVLAINRKESKVQAQRYLSTVPDLNNLVIVLDTKDTFYKSIGGFTMPETIFYDAAGNVIVHKRGFMKLPEMRQHLDSAITATNDDQ